MKNYYIIVSNVDRCMQLNDILIKNKLHPKISPIPRSVDKEASCGLSILVNEDEIDNTKLILNDYKNLYINIVETDSLIKKDRYKFC